jgi:integrase/recombinase XerD
MKLRNVHSSAGPFGKLDVKLGKGVRGLGPGPRWVPLLD